MVDWNKALTAYGRQNTNPGVNSLTSNTAMNVLSTGNTSPLAHLMSQPMKQKLPASPVGMYPAQSSPTSIMSQPTVGMFSGQPTGGNFAGQPARNVPISSGSQGNPFASPRQSPQPVKTPVQPMFSGKEPGTFMGAPIGGGIMSNVLFHANNLIGRR